MKGRKSMRKAIIIILVNLLIISFCYANAPRKEFVKEVQEESREGPEIPGDITYEQANVTVLMEKGMSQSLMTEVKDAVSYYSPEILQKFNEEGWKIMLVSSVDFSDSEYEGESDLYPQWTVGFTNYKTKIIQIKDIGITGHVRLKLLHEMGHYVDKYYDYVSYSDEFQKIYETYKDSYTEYEFTNVKKTKENREDLEYAASCEPEFFACTYKDYVYHPDYLKEEYKEIFDFFNTLDNGKG